jgi:hypothetical protein
VILDFDRDAPPSDCDIAVVGAGAVGIPLAIALMRRGKRVLLIEGGGRSLEKTSQDLMHGIASGHAMDGLHNGRFRMLGGTSNFWGGQLARFQDVVFAERPWLDSPGWPFGRDTLQPHYDAAMRMLGMAACPSDDAVWKALDVMPPAAGSAIELYLTRWLKNPNLTHVFRRELEGEEVQVLVHANVIGFVADVSGTGVSALQLRSVSGRQARVAAQQVVLANGTIEIARLLMLPFADGRPTPWNANAWLGRGFCDHVDATAGTLKLRDKQRFHDMFDNMFVSGFKFNPKLRLTAQAQTAIGGVDTAGYFVFHSALREHIENFKILVRALLNGRVSRDLWKLPVHVLSLAGVIFPMVIRYLRSNRMFNPADAGISFVLTSEQWPNRDSRISLANERDALDLPKVKVAWALDGREVATLRQFAIQVREWLAASGLADLEIDSDLLAGNSAFLAKVHDANHQMGGARMGRTEADGVVDPHLKVFGSHNLHVAGAAVFPSTGYANPTLTAIALGLRLAARLAN